MLLISHFDFHLQPKVEINGGRYFLAHKHNPIIQTTNHISQSINHLIQKTLNTKKIHNDETMMKLNAIKCEGENFVFVMV